MKETNQEVVKRFHKNARLVALNNKLRQNSIFQALIHLDDSSSVFEENINQPVSA